MTDDTPSTSSASDEPRPAPQQPVPPAAGGWSTRRVPLAIAGAALLAGCVLGAGAAAVGAVAVGAWTDHGGNHSFRHDREGNRGGTGRPDGWPGNVPMPVPAPTLTAIPSPSSS